jgi:hypothetical protein
MSNSSGILRAIEYAFVASVAVSLGVLLIGVCAFGFQFDQWAEWEGRLVGVAGTIAGVAGAVVGLKTALRSERRAVE